MDACRLQIARRSVVSPHAAEIGAELNGVSTVNDRHVVFELRALLDAGVRVVSLSAEERSLEDAYLSILAEARR